MTRSFLPLLSMLKFVMVSPTEKAVSFRDNFDGASRSRDLVQNKMRQAKDPNRGSSGPGLFSF
jgi:hypothetical protein